MENYHLTKQEQFDREDRAISNAMDIAAEKRAKEKEAVPIMTQLVKVSAEKELLKQENARLKDRNENLLMSLKELLHIYEDSTFGDLVYRLWVKEFAETQIKLNK